MKTKTIFIVFVVVVLGLLAWQITKQVTGFVQASVTSEDVAQPTTVNAAKFEDQKASKGKGPAVQIIKHWDLPDELMEISALSYVGDDQFACVQDEKGSIFIYNIAKRSIEKEIAFAGPGDYEGLAIAGSTAYVINSAGQIFEVQNLMDINNLVKQYKTPLSTRENIEGFCFDKTNNRLLIAPKDKDPNSSSYKGIYSFDLATKRYIPEPVYKIQLEAFEAGKGKKKKTKDEIRPSAISLRNGSSDIYIIDGPSARLLILNPDGNVKSLIDLDKKEFPQAEGITFNPKGEMFISNEGTKKKSGTILQVTLPGE